MSQVNRQFCTAVALAVLALALSAVWVWAAPLSRAGTVPQAGPDTPAATQDFQDVPPSSPFYAYLHNLAIQGIVSGYACGGPGEPCVPPDNLPYYRSGNAVTRLQMTKFIDLARHAPGIAISSTTNLAPVIVTTTRGTPLTLLNYAGDGLFAESESIGNGIVGFSNADGAGILGISITGPALSGTGNDGAGVYGTSTNGPAGFFEGSVTVTQNCCAAEVGTFRLDNPRDPANAYLNQAAVESPNQETVYNGNVTTDAAGRATVQLPPYAEALGGDFRYQLTVIGQFAQAIVASTVANNQFTIRTDKPNVEVSWQVTGLRHDVWVQEHPMPAEVPKSDSDRGKYLYPQGYGQPADSAIGHWTPPTTPRK